MLDWAKGRVRACADWAQGLDDGTCHRRRRKRLDDGVGTRGHGPRDDGQRVRGPERLDDGCGDYDCGTQEAARRPRGRALG